MQILAILVLSSACIAAMLPFTTLITQCATRHMASTCPRSQMQAAAWTFARRSTGVSHKHCDIAKVATPPPPSSSSVATVPQITLVGNLFAPHFAPVSNKSFPLIFSCCYFSTNQRNRLQTDKCAFLAGRTLTSCVLCLEIIVTHDQRLFIFFCSIPFIPGQPIMRNNINLIISAVMNRCSRPLPDHQPSVSWRDSHALSFLKWAKIDWIKAIRSGTCIPLDFLGSVFKSFGIFLFSDVESIISNFH